MEQKNPEIREPGINIRGDWIFTFSDGTVIEKKNLVVQTGLEFLAGVFTGEEIADVAFYIALGTGSQAATSSDVVLRAEGIRKVITSKQRQMNVVRFRAFFIATEANGDWFEFGLFAAGTEVKDSGIMFNRVVTPVSKASNQVMTIECRITFSAN